MSPLDELKSIRARLDILIAELEPKKPTITIKRRILAPQPSESVQQPLPTFAEFCDEPKLSSKLLSRQKQYRSCLRKLEDPAVQAIPSKFAWYQRFKLMLEEAGL